MDIQIYTDGGARGNPGTAGCGAYIIDQDGNEIKKIYKPLGIKTNNQAEYAGAYIGLQAALEMNPKSIKLFMDSKLIVEQLNGNFKVKNLELKQAFNDIQELLGDYKGALTITHVPRKENKIADKLANKAMDESS